MADDLPEVPKYVIKDDEAEVGHTEDLQADIVKEFLHKAEVDLEPFMREVKHCVSTNNLSQLLAKSTQMTNDAIVKTMEAVAKNRLMAKEKEDEEKRSKMLEHQLREVNSASVASLQAGLVPVFRKEHMDITTKVVKQELGKSMDEFKMFVITSMVAMVRGELGKVVRAEKGPMMETIQAAMGGIDMLVRNQANSW